MDDAIEGIVTKVCGRLKIETQEQRDCVKFILRNTISFNEHRTGELSEEKLEGFITVLGGYMSEIKLISDDPVKYREKLARIRQSVHESHSHI